MTNLQLLELLQKVEVDVYDLNNQMALARIQEAIDEIARRLRRLRAA